MANKPKFKRRVVGSVMKSKETTKPDYIKIKENITLAEGQTLSLESKKFQLERLETAFTEGKLTEEMYGQIRARLEKTPDFVRFDIVLLER